MLHYNYISYLADAFIQSYLQMRTREAIKINKGTIICKYCDKSQLVLRRTRSVFYCFIINKNKKVENKIKKPKERKGLLSSLSWMDFLPSFNPLL